MSLNDQSVNNRYVIDVEHGAETARLIEQDKLFTNAIGGLFPPSVVPEKVQTVLDLACGPGGWALEVAFTYPHVQVVGVDINQMNVRYGFAQARARCIQNVDFQVMDVCKPLEFRSHTFDIVNGRFLVSFLDTTSWPKLLQECRWILKPGGMLILTECEQAVSNSLALQELSQCVSRAFMQQHRSFSVDGTTLGITHMLGKLLQDAGFLRVSQQPFVLDASCGTELHYAFFRNIEASFILLKPFLLSSGVIEEETFMALYQQMLQHMIRVEFRCLSYGLCASGIVPAFAEA